MRLLDTFNTLEHAAVISSNIDSEIYQNLRFNLRSYQKKVINRIDYYINEYNTILNIIITNNIILLFPCS